MERTCEACGKVLVQAPEEPNYRFKVRRCCDRRCGTRMSWLSRPERIGDIPKQKRCESCGVRFSKRDIEANYQYMRRKTCSTACRIDLLHTKGYRTPTPLPPTKICKQCNKTFAWPAYLRRKDWKKKLYCGEECMRQGIADQRRKDVLHHVGPKQCVECGDTFTPRQGEYIANYRNRLTCSDICRYQRARRTKGARKWRTSPYPIEWTYALRESIRDRDSRACQLCGATEGRRKLPVHHVNMNKQDCRAENLVTLCGRCHARVHSSTDGEMITTLLIAMMAERDAA